MPDHFCLDQQTAAIHALAGEKRVVDSPVAVVKIGQALQVVHDVLGPQQFQEWLGDEFDWGQSAASNWMRSAACFGHIVEDLCLGQFRHTALYELARGNVPSPARDEAVIAAREGQDITLPVAREIIRRHLGAAPSIHQLTCACKSVRSSIVRIEPELEDFSELQHRRALTELVGLRDFLQPLIDRLLAIDVCEDEVRELQDYETLPQRKPDTKVHCFHSIPE